MLPCLEQNPPCNIDSGLQILYIYIQSNTNNHLSVLFKNLFTGEELLLELLTISSLSSQPSVHGGRWLLSASEITIQEMSLSGTQYNSTRHFLHSIKMDWMIHDFLTWLLMWQSFKWTNSPTLGDRGKLRKGCLWLKSNIVPHKAPSRKKILIWLILKESIN